MTTTAQDKASDSINPVALWFVRAVPSLLVYYFALSYCIDGIGWYRHWKPEITGAFAFMTVVNFLTLAAIFIICVGAAVISVGRLLLVALAFGCLQPLFMVWFGGS